MIQFHHCGGRWFERRYPPEDRARADAFASEINRRFRQREYFRLICDRAADGTLVYKYQLHLDPLWPHRLAALLALDPQDRI